MARVQFVSPIEEIRGSIAGNTYSKNTSGPIMRARRVPSQPLSSMQSNSLAALNIIQTYWRSLDPFYQNLWDVFALAHTRVNMFGKTTKLSGAQWFSVINNNRQLLDETILDTPPVYVLPAAPTYDAIVATLIGLWVDFDVISIPVGEAWFIYTTPLNFIYNKKNVSQFRLTDFAISTDPVHFPIKDQWSAAHGIPWPPSPNVYAQMQIILYSVTIATGLSSPAIFDSEAIILTT